VCVCVCVCVCVVGVGAIEGVRGQLDGRFNVQMNGVRMISDNDVHTRAHTALVSLSPCIDLSIALRASVRSCPTRLPVPSELTVSPFGVTATCQPA